MSSRAVSGAVGLTLVAGAAWGQSVFNMPSGQRSLEFVTVGNAGNSPDSVVQSVAPSSVGAVSYAYRIGKFEVTNAQYARFLNSVAASDPTGLWAAPGSFGGINRSGTDGSYTYSVIPGRENGPVVSVSWYDAARFVNWLHNGEGSGSTESGVYTFTGPTTVVGGRSPTAQYFLPTEDEWYKAAYHQPADQGGDADGFWQYMNRSNTWTASNDDLTGANIKDSNGTFWVNNSTSLGFPQPYPFRPVGTYIDNPTFYGAFDMGGNASEWNETLGFGVNPDARGVRGGSFQSNFPNGSPLSDNLISSALSRSAVPTAQQNFVGFRIGAVIPTPGAGLVAALAITFGAARRRRDA